MCDPVTLGIAALSGAAALFGNSDKPSPPPATPAIAPTTARTPGADVKVGDGAVKDKTAATPQYDGFTEQRVFGKPLGGLGKGGLGL